jgi:hypothetical protein
MFDNLDEINKENAAKDLAATRHQEKLAHIDLVGDNVLSTTESLIKYIEGHVSKVEVVNQLESISTPDVKYVVEALQVLDSTLKTHENTDLTEITGVMRELLNEAKALPKVLPDNPEQKFVDYTTQLTGLANAIKGVEKVVKAQKLIAEAPIVNVPETSVNVDAPDLAPLQDGIKDVVSAVKDIVIPEYKTDNAGVEKLLKTANKLLTSLLEKPVGAGGGGAGLPFVGDSGYAQPLTLFNDALPVTAAALTERYDYDVATTIYTAVARRGTSEGSTGWTITKYDLTDTNNASGKIATDVSWTSRASGTYN